MNQMTGKPRGNCNDPTSTPESDSESKQDPIDAWAASVGSKSRYYNPDPLVRLTGKSNESTIIIDGEKHTALIDSRAQVTTITTDLVNKLKLPIYGLHTLLNFQGTGGGRIPYHVYVEVKMEIPEIMGFKENVPMMVINDDEYGKGVPIQVGTLHIDDIIAKATPEEFALLGKGIG